MKLSERFTAIGAMVDIVAMLRIRLPANMAATKIQWLFHLVLSCRFAHLEESRPEIPTLISLYFFCCPYMYLIGDAQPKSSENFINT